MTLPTWRLIRSLDPRFMTVAGASARRATPLRTLLGIGLLRPRGHFDATGLELIAIQRLDVAELGAREDVVHAFDTAFAPELAYMWGAVGAASLLAVIGVAGAFC